MGYIKEPKGVNFTVINKGLSDEERAELTSFINRSKKRKQSKIATLNQPKKQTRKKVVIL